MTKKSAFIGLAIATLAVGAVAREAVVKPSTTRRPTSRW